MLSWYYLGVAQYYSTDFASSIVSLEQAYKLAERLRSESYMGLSSMMIGYVYSKTYLPADALEATMESVQHFAAVPDSFQVRRAQCTLGERFMQMGRFHEADSLFEQVLLSDQCDSFNVRKALLGQAVAVYYDDILSGASRSLQLFTEALNTYSASLTPYYADYYARALYDSGHKMEADGILAQLKAADNGHERSAYLEHYIANKGNDAESITKTSQHLLALQDSIMRASMEQSVLHSQRDYLDKVNSLLAQESSTRKRVNWLMAITLILSSVVLCMTLHYILRRKRYLENDMVQLSEQMHLMTSEMDELRQQYISAYKGQFQRISHLIELYYSTSGSRSGRDEVYKEVMNLATTVGKDQKTYASLERNVNRHLENAMKIYRQRFPDMGEDHYRLVCYFMAGYPASTIELLTGLSQNAIYARKRRIINNLASDQSGDSEPLLRYLR